MRRDTLLGRENLLRLVALILIVVVVCVYVYMKWPQFYRGVLGGAPAAEDDAAVTALAQGMTGAVSDFFIDYRLERERTRGQQVEMLRELINNPQADDASRKSAGDRWLAIVEAMGREGELENLIRAKGFADAVVFIQERATVVVVKAPDLSQQEAAKIMDIVTRGTGMKLEAVTLVVKPQ